ncbi:MAG TPA: hypothetical protein PKC40_02550 [Saprospiraceae bacterium]|nr:hypothetical protein [Saprospiraceae bacterium]
MGRFLLKIFLFLIPPLALIAWGEYQFFDLKETMPVTEVLDEQMKSTEECYYHRLFFDNNLAIYKYEGINRVKPDILVLGQSIVLQIRDFMFHPLEDKFYNAGHLISNVTELEQIIQFMREGKLHKPKVIIFGMDGGLPKANFWLDWRRSFDAEYDDPVHDLNAHARALQKYFNSFIQPSKTTIPERRETIGFGYMGQRGYGYRHDGSTLMGREVTEYLQHPQVFKDRKNLYEMLIAHTPPFNHPLNFNPDKEKRVKKCLDDFRDLGIELFVFTTPYADAFLEKALRDSSFGVFWKDLNAMQKSIKKEMKYPFFEVERPSSLKLDDRFMLDASHPGEVLMGMLLLRFFKKHPEQLGYLKNVDMSYLENKLRDPKTTPLSFMEENPLILQKYEQIITDREAIKEVMQKVLDVLDENLLIDQCINPQ